jgi:hypothetical protein
MNDLMDERWNQLRERSQTPKDRILYNSFIERAQNGHKYGDWKAGAVGMEQTVWEVRSDCQQMQGFFRG